MDTRQLLMLQAVCSGGGGESRDRRVLKTAIRLVDRGEGLPQQLTDAIKELVRRRGLN